ncbi:hypothetical protein ACGFX8_31420, partial [Streptomyces sp. NPDC048362]
RGDLAQLPYRPGGQPLTDRLRPLTVFGKTRLVDDPEVARRLKAIQADMAQEGGTRRAADLIEAELPADRHR